MVDFIALDFKVTLGEFDAAIGAVPFHEDFFSFTAFLQCAQSGINRSFYFFFALFNAKCQRLNAQVLRQDGVISTCWAEFGHVREQRHLIVQIGLPFALLQRLEGLLRCPCPRARQPFARG